MNVLLTAFITLDKHLIEAIMIIVFLTLRTDIRSVTTNPCWYYLQTCPHDVFLINDNALTTPVP